MGATIGIAGCGRMGTAFARRLVETGHEVLVWNRTPARTQAAVEAGARAAGDLAELAGAGTLILSLTDAEAVAAVLDGLAPHLAGRLVVEMSTLLPADQQQNARRAEAAGADFLECPVGGTVAPALKGQLLGFAGGTGPAFHRAEPVLAQLCRRVVLLGPVGQGARMKLAVNLPLALYWAVLGEALALPGGGPGPETVIGLIADSSAGPAVLKNRAQVVIDTLAGVDQPGTFDIAGLRKDLALALRLAESEGRSLPLAETALAAYDRALAEGLGRLDGASLTRRVLQG